MKVRKEWIDSKESATQGDLSNLQEDMHLDLVQMEERMIEKFATKETVATILEIVKSIDKRLKSWEGIPAAVRDLQNRIFKLEVKSRR